MKRALAVTVTALAAAALISSCGSSSGLIPSVTASSLINDLGNIQAGVLAGDCTLTNQAIQTAETDFGELPASVDSKLRSQLSAGLSAVVIGAQRKCALNANTGSTSSTGPTTATGPTGATSTTRARRRPRPAPAPPPRPPRRPRRPARPPRPRRPARPRRRARRRPARPAPPAGRSAGPRPAPLRPTASAAAPAPEVPGTDDGARGDRRRALPDREPARVRRHVDRPPRLRRAPRAPTSPSSCSPSTSPRTPPSCRASSARRSRRRA